MQVKIPLGTMEKEMETTIVYRGYMGGNGQENGNYYTIVFGGYMGIMEKIMETIIYP